MRGTYQSKWKRMYPDLSDEQREQFRTRLKSKEYWYAHREKCLTRKAKYRQEHREEIRARDKAYRELNPEAVRTWKATYRKRYPEKVREYDATYRQRHPEKIKEKDKRWQQENPLKKRENTAKRHALKKSVAIGTIDFAAIITRDKSRCGICHKKVKPKDMHFDHIVPLSKGGAHAEHNIQVAHASCNVRKGGNGRLPSQTRLPI